jgi:hypothetical protein
MLPDQQSTLAPLPARAPGARQPARISIGQIDILVNNQPTPTTVSPAAPALRAAEQPVSQELAWFQLRP